jgi:4-amino-4-deoxy-L-arabinose transferase-like glycosyltransferase
MLAVQLAFLAYPGLQEDELVFALPFLHGNVPLYSWHSGALHIPIMLVDYLGTLKSLLYWPVFQIWSPNVWSIRVPVCALSVCTLLLFGGLIKRAAGTGVAILACALLASDASFIFCSLFDWGPVSLLLFGTVAVTALACRFLDSHRTFDLVLAGLVAGLSLWYKAAFIFPLAGLGGAVLLCRKLIRSHLSLRTYLIAIAAFVAGSSPLLIYNFARAGQTFRTATQLETAPITEKLMMLRMTLEGRALEHYMFRSFPKETIALQGAPLPDLVMRWYSNSRFSPGSALYPALLLSILALPFVSSSSVFKPLVFTWAAFLISLLFMITFPGAGSGPHHTVLLYPAPQFIVAATAWAVGTDRLHVRRLAQFAVLLIVCSNLWLLRDYNFAARRNGFSVYWSDGLPELVNVARLKGMPAAVLDWGIYNGVQIESRGAIPITKDLTPRTGVLYIGHCAGYVIDQAAARQFDRLTETSGMVRYDAAIVRDREGSAVYCLFSLKH